MLWLVASVLFALVDEAAFFDEADDDFDEAYYEDDFFTSPVTVSRDYVRKRRSDVTNCLNRFGTKHGEYDDTEVDLIVPKPDLPLTMLPVLSDIPKSSRKLNTDDPGFRIRSSKPNTDMASQKPPKNFGIPYIDHLHPKRSANPETDIHHYVDFPTRSPNSQTDLTAYTESQSSGNPSNDITYQSLPTRSSELPLLNLNIPTISDKSENDLTIYPDLLKRSANPNDFSFIPSASNPSRSTTAVTDTTTDTVPTISTLPTTTEVSTTNSSSSLLFLTPVGFPLTPYGHMVYRTTEDYDADDLRARSFDIFTKRKRVKTKPPPAIPVNVPLLLKIIDNLTMDYDWNLTRRFNESLQKYNIPTCQSFTTLTTETPNTNLYENASLVAKTDHRGRNIFIILDARSQSKDFFSVSLHGDWYMNPCQGYTPNCFVCGLRTKGVPYDSRCADAFSGDFIPLVPVDAKARGSISRYRKYCRYVDVNGVVENPFEPRSMFGRFTGGCSVRWVDVTSIYTQRTCRNRRRAVMGNHFGSKRMAKLEMALSDVENGCIVSPVATLLPLSRGISLYARFHACVCTGDWCNRAVQIPTWTTNITILSMLVIVMVVS